MADTTTAPRVRVAGQSTNGDEDPAAAQASGGRRWVAVTAIIVVCAAGITFGGRQYLFSRHHITTDNAQVEGHITPVLARVGGYVTEVRISDNQQVEAGDTLVVLDDRELRARLAQADAELAALLATTDNEDGASQAQAQQAVARAAAAAADAAVIQAEANAERARADLVRFEPLAARNIVSQQQFDGIRTAAAAAEAQLVAARHNATAADAQFAAASAGLSSAGSRAAAARAAREQVALQLSYTRIVAPASGVVTKRSVEVGQLTSPGQPLMSVVPMHDLWVVANLKETEIEKVRPGDPVEFSVDAYPGQTFHGTVESLSPATGARFSLLPPDNATGNFTKVVQRIPTRIQVTDEGDSGPTLRPGMSAEVVVTTR